MYYINPKYSTVKPVLEATCVKQLATCIKQACIHFPKQANTLKHTVKILKIGTPKIITIIVLQLEQLDFTVQ